ncbi:MAG: hypothetical protein ACI8UO_004641 [Verrucomicrobiales bacterium]|jgi:hypothetical protein
MKPVRQNSKRGFTLLEAILAIFLFALTAVALAEALNMIGVASFEGQEDARVEEILRTYLTEASRAPEIEVGTETVKLEDGLTQIRVVTEELLLNNRDGDDLADMLRIEVVVFRKESGGEKILGSAETWRYNPLYQANQVPR